MDYGSNQNYAVVLDSRTECKQMAGPFDRNHEEAWANARLIAAAPELFAALVAKMESEDALDKAHDPEREVDQFARIEEIDAAQKLMFAANDLARAAIAKAKGAA